MTLDEILAAVDAEALVEPPFNVDFESACADDLQRLSQ